MKRLFSRLLHWLIAHKRPGLAAVIASAAVSALDFRLTRARWDGQDWEFKWSGGCLYSPTHQIRPKFVTQQNIGMYLMEYKPKPGDLIFEVGAGSGTEVCTLSNAVGPAGRIVAIEADPTAARLLKKQANALEYHNVTIVETAVGSEERFIDLHTEAAGGVGNSTAAIVGGETITVRCQRLDNIVEDLGIQSISFIKMNIEGAEYDALIGMGASIKRAEKIFVSCHDFTGVDAQKTYGRVYEYLDSLGMRLKTLPPNAEKPWEQYYIFGSWEEQRRLADSE